MHVPDQQPQPHQEDPRHPDGDKPVRQSSPADAEAETTDSPETADNEAPRIWVGSLSDYNNGVLHGSWIDANQDAEDLQLAIQAVLGASPWAARTGEPAEEWGIFDYDNFGAVRLDQHDSLSRVSAVARGIAEHGLAFAAWADVMEDEGMLGGFEAAYLGHYDSVEDYAAQLVDDLGYNQVLDESLPATSGATWRSTLPLSDGTWSSAATSMSYRLRAAASGYSTPMRNNHIGSPAFHPLWNIHITGNLCCVFATELI